MSVGRWQQQMEEHLVEVRQNTRMLQNASRLADGLAQAYAAAAQANATAALALSVALTGGDVEVALSRLAAAVAE